MELNREQIVKAVAELRKRGLSNGVALGHHAGWCDEVADLLENALALIRELTEENERFSLTRYMVTPDGKIEMIPSVKLVKVDTVRKMQRRLKAKFYIQGNDEYFIVGEKLIDQVAKEMLEDV